MAGTLLRRAPTNLVAPVTGAPRAPHDVSIGVAIDALLGTRERANVLHELIEKLLRTRKGSYNHVKDKDEAVGTRELVSFHDPSFKTRVN